MSNTNKAVGAATDLVQKLRDSVHELGLRADQQLAEGSFDDCIATLKKQQAAIGALAATIEAIKVLQQ